MKGILHLDAIPKLKHFFNAIHSKLPMETTCFLGTMKNHLKHVIHKILLDNHGITRVSRVPDNHIPIPLAFFVVLVKLLLELQSPRELLHHIEIFSFLKGIVLNFDVAALTAHVQGHMSPKEDGCTTLGNPKTSSSLSGNGLGIQLGRWDTGWVLHGLRGGKFSRKVEA